MTPVMPLSAETPPTETTSVPVPTALLKGFSAYNLASDIQTCGFLLIYTFIQLSHDSPGTGSNSGRFRTRLSSTANAN